MEWTKYPFVKFVLYFFAGIFTANTLRPEKPGVITVLVISIVCYLFVHFYYWEELTKLRLKPVKGFLIAPILFCLGILFFYNSSPIYHHTHISKYQFSEYIGVIDTKPEIKNSKRKFVVKVLEVLDAGKRKRAVGKVLCYIDSTVIAHKNDTVIIAGTPTEPKDPLNPEEFNYKDFLAKKGITHIHFIKSGKFKLKKGRPNYLYSIANNSADWVRKIIITYVPGQAESALTLGLILGEKQLLSAEVKEKFSESGLVHILAVSGFHVALIYQVILIVTAFLKRFSGGHIAIFIISIVSLWLYAIMTGMSPSVIRATSMFSVVLVANLLRRKAHSMHNLVLACFLILVSDPLTAFDVGFQLSVLAVSGIIIFNGRISNLYQPKSLVLQKAWETISISASAQILTFPLVLLLFKDFPVYFLLSNLIAVVPVLFIIYGALLLPAVSVLPFLAQKLGWFISFCCRVLSGSVDLISQLPDPFSQQLNSTQVLLLFLGILMILLGIGSRKLLAVKSGFLLIIGFILYVSISKHHLNHQQLFMVFQVEGHSAVGIINGPEAVIVSDISLHERHKVYTFHIAPFLTSRSVREVKFIQNEGPFCLKQKGVLIEVRDKDELSFVSDATFAVLRNPNINLLNENIISGQRLLILDGSTASNKRKSINLPVYKTWEQGAFVAELNQ